MVAETIEQFGKFDVLVLNTIEATGPLDLDALAAILYKDSAIQRPNTVDEFAAMSVFLAADAPAGITGSAMNVDGRSSPY